VYSKIRRSISALRDYLVSFSPFTNHTFGSMTRERDMVG
jgi:hypothetical protein